MNSHEHQMYLLHLRDKLREAVRLEERSELVYVKVRRGYREDRRWRTVANEMTSQDPRAKTAVADGKFHRERATMYATAIAAEIALRERTERLLAETTGE